MSVKHKVFILKKVDLRRQLEKKKRIHWDFVTVCT